jgi:hypothetical protein
MGNNTKNDKKLTNGAILIVSKVLKHVMSSAAEAEIGAVFINAKEGAVLRTTLEELGHTQPPTPMEIDNTTVTGYSNGTIKQKRTKAMDMRFYWIKYRVKKGQFRIFWGPGFQNLADYFTKRHSPAHHKRIRDIYIHADERPINRKGIRDSALRGCVNTSGKAGSQIPHLPLGGDSSPLGEIMQYVCKPTRSTRLCVTSHSQPLINTKYKFQVTNYLQTIFQTITNEPIGLIIFITSWLTINISPFTLGKMNIIKNSTTQGYSPRARLLFSLAPGPKTFLHQQIK